MPNPRFEIACGSFRKLKAGTPTRTMSSHFPILSWHSVAIAHARYNNGSACIIFRCSLNPLHHCGLPDHGHNSFTVRKALARLAHLGTSGITQFSKYYIQTYPHYLFFLSMASISLLNFSGTFPFASSGMPTITPL